MKKYTLWILMTGINVHANGTSAIALTDISPSTEQVPLTQEEALQNAETEKAEEALSKQHQKEVGALFTQHQKERQALQKQQDARLEAKKSEDYIKAAAGAALAAGIAANISEDVTKIVIRQQDRPKPFSKFFQDLRYTFKKNSSKWYENIGEKIGSVIKHNKRALAEAGIDWGIGYSLRKLWDVVKKRKTSPWKGQRDDVVKNLH